VELPGFRAIRVLNLSPAPNPAAKNRSPGHFAAGTGIDVRSDLTEQSYT
jgi:hypothetical protein